MKSYVSIAVTIIALLFVQSTVLAQSPLIEIIDPADSVLDFGCVTVAVTHRDFVTIKNVSEEGVFVFPSFVGGTGFVTGTGNIGMAPDSQSDIPVEFTPLAEGDATCVLTLHVVGSVTESEQFFEIDLIGTGGTCEPSVLIETILTFLDYSVAGGTIAGTGGGNKAANRLSALRNRLKTIDFLIQNGHLNAALKVTSTAIARTDGDSSPPDFVEDIGDSGSTSVLNGLLSELFILLSG